MYTARSKNKAGAMCCVAIVVVVTYCIPSWRHFLRSVLIRVTRIVNAVSACAQVREFNDGSEGALDRGFLSVRRRVARQTLSRALVSPESGR